MAITYSYKIDRMTKVDLLDGLRDVIVHVRFTYTGTDENDITGEFAGAIPMPSPTSEDFTPLANLTENQVIEWVKAYHPVENMQEKIQEQITKKKLAEADVPLPWSTEV